MKILNQNFAGVQMISKLTHPFFILLIVFITTLTIIQSCQKSEKNLKSPHIDFENKALLNTFISSQEFKSLNIEYLGKIDSKRSGIIYIDNDKNKPLLNILFVKDDKITGVIEAIKNPSKSILLPNNQAYYMLLRDFTNFNTETKTGTIKMIDLNYDNHVFNSIQYNNGTAIQATYNELPNSIKEKYVAIASHNKEYQTTLSDKSTVARKAVPCDENKNGNLGFSECYACYNRACSGSSSCYTLCYGIGDVAGWLITGVPHCQISIGAACVYLSSVY
jgi:hypothetical protein